MGYIAKCDGLYCRQNVVKVKFGKKKRENVHGNLVKYLKNKLKWKNWKKIWRCEFCYVNSIEIDPKILEAIK